MESIGPEVLDLTLYSLVDYSEFIEDYLAYTDTNMSAPLSAIHALDRSDYSKHRLVTISGQPPQALATSSIRFRSRILGLTTNNLTYARLGHLMGWYDIYPLPSDLPAPYNDKEKYARIAAWGYAEILESTIPGIAAGQSIYGYLPISNSHEDVRVEYSQRNGEVIDNQIVVLDEHRQHVWKIYNRYQVCPPLTQLEHDKGLDSLGWDSLMQGLFGTSYNMSKYAFAWEEHNRIHPSGNGDWSAADADLRDATVVILNASGKTGMSFAYNLRHNRPKAHQPKTIIGVGSPASVQTIANSGFYDQAVLNSDAESIAVAVARSDTRRIVLFDFGAREGANELWKSSLSGTSIPFTLITVGGEVGVQNPEKARKRLANLSETILVHASNLREKGIENGGAKYFEEFHQAFDEFKKRTVGVELRWGEGLEGWEAGWEAFCRDEIRADAGLVYRV